MQMPSSSALTFAQLWTALGPELLLAGFGLLIMIIEMFLPKDRRRALPWLALVGVVIAFVMTCARWHQRLAISNALYVNDGFADAFKLLLLATLGLCLLMVIDYRKRVRLPGEHSYLLIFATVGAMVMVSSLDLITLFVGLELLSLSTYILVAMRRDYRGSEAALKYLVSGGIASAFILYGFSFLFGMTGEVNIVRIQYAFANNLWAYYHGLSILAILFIVVGFGVKLAVVPFHMWAPDTYEGAPTPVTTYLAVASKTAALGMLYRVLLMGVGQNLADWYRYIIIIAVATMIVGNIAALSQRGMKRLMAFSSIAQAGYVLVPLAVLGRATTSGNVYQAMSALIYYLAAYMFMTVGLFAIVSMVNQETGRPDIAAFSGLYRRSPYLAVSTIIFALSLAGLPFTGGFIGKLYIFMGTLTNGLPWLGGLLFIGSVISFYYYFRVIRASVQAPALDEDPQPAVRVAPVLGTVVTLCLLGTLILGVIPGWLMNVLSHVTWF